MISLRLTALLAASTGLFATPALAQTADTPSWSGFYVGGALGYGFQPKDNDEIISFDKNPDGTFGDQVSTAAGANAFSPGFCGGRANGATPAQGCRDDKDGVDWQVHAGYDRQFGSIVVGLVGDYGRATITDSVSAFSTTPASYTMTRRLRDHASIRARAGFSFGGTLVYGTGGGAWGKVRNSFTTTNTANTFTGNGNENAYGYTAGGGVEQLLAPNFSIGVQYLFTSLKANDYRVHVGRGTAPATNPFVLTNAGGTDFLRTGSRFNSSKIQATASFRF